jgi:DNA replication and repair protein RecF
MRSYQGIKKLSLHHYRNYKELTISCDERPVVLTGCNGVGKTNILEAISFFSPGKGLRSAKISDVQISTLESSMQSNQPINWAVFACLTNQGDEYQIGTAGFINDSGRESRRVSMNGRENLSQSNLTEVVSVLWLTPAMDRLFLDGTSSRRKFFDRIVFSFKASHAKHINRFELKMRERNRLIYEGSADKAWLRAVEKQMSLDAFEIISARFAVLDLLKTSFAEGFGPFPTPAITLNGGLEELWPMAHESFVSQYCFLLESGRVRDQQAGRTLCGPHTSDFSVIYEEKNQHAPNCSTGEQKALLISIILGAARIKSKSMDSTTIVLLDEVVAHLDDYRRQCLLDEVTALPLQTWMTGTDESFFKSAKEKIQHFQVGNSMVKIV